MESYVIEARKVSRSFGEAAAVRDLDLRVGEGRIYGLLGRNGAGKTTLIKMLVGLIWPDSGEVRVNGVEPARFTVEGRWRLGYVSEKQILNPSMRVDALIRFTSSFYPNWDFAVCERLLKRFEIEPGKRIRALSAGMARQVAFLLALAQKPDLLILDEPAVNLDVVARREFLDEMLELLRQEGKTVLLSSHILSDVERVADEIGIMVQGRLRISEPLDRLKETVKKVRFFGFEGGTSGFEMPDALQLSKTKTEVLAVLRLGEEEPLRRLAAEHRCRYEVMDMNLEDIFVEMVRDPKERA